MKIHTIGFTKKSAEEFFNSLKESGAERLVDVRLRPDGGLAGFAKKSDIQFFLRELCGMEYVHMPDLAPTKEMLDAYRKEHKDWEVYEREFLALMEEREIEKTLDPEVASGGCLLCSEHEPGHCHRRLVAEYLQRHWGGVEIAHLPSAR